MNSSYKIWMDLFIRGLLLVIFLFSLPLYAGSVTLAWDANTEPELVGYKLAYGNSSGQYSTLIDVQNVTRYTVALPSGTYYFAVKAYGIEGLESAYSNEVSATVTRSRCDLDSDGLVNRTDLELMARRVVGMQGAGEDLNGDGNINALDLQILISVYLGKRTCP